MNKSVSVKEMMAILKDQQAALTSHEQSIKAVRITDV